MIFFFTLRSVFSTFFFFNDTATTEIYTLSLHDALPISSSDRHSFESITFQMAHRRTGLFVGSFHPRQSKCPRVGAFQHRERDRKSTRLNSSHGYISYAVFCLKKKKTIAPPLYESSLHPP